MELDPDRISELYRDSPDFVEDLRPRLIASPVLERARDTQAELSARRYNADELDGAWDTLQHITNRLDQEAGRQGLAREAARLEGSSLRLPSYERDLARDRLVLALADQPHQEAQSLESFLHPHEIQGQFYGFTIRFERISEGPLDTYMPVLSYQLLVHRVETPHSSLALLATGDVGVARLEFAQDAQLETDSKSLTFLLSIPHEGITRNTNTLNVIMNEPGAFDASRLRSAGFYANKILHLAPAELVVQVQDALLEILSRCISFGSRYEVSASECRQMFDPRKPKAEEQELSPSPSSFTSTLDGVVFQPMRIWKDGSYVELERQGAQLAFHTDDKLLTMPLMSLDVFTKQ